MQTNFIKNLLNLEDVIVKNIKNLKEKVEIYIELPVKEHLCPYCGAETTKIHDYYLQLFLIHDQLLQLVTCSLDNHVLFQVSLFSY